MDRIALRFVLLLLTAFAALFAWPRSACASWHVDGDRCDSSDRANSWTRAEKQRTRQRVWDACKTIGGSDLYCAYWDAVIRRESWGGIASAVHTLGTDADGTPEYGLGPMGLSVRWHHGKWPGEDEDPAFCSPEVSFLVGHAIALGAVEKYKAANTVEIQAVFGGGRGFVRCVETGSPSWFRHVPILRWFHAKMPPRRTCRAAPTARTARSVCSRMPGYTCWSPITRHDLGDTSGLIERRGTRYVVTQAGRTWALARARGS